MGRMTIKEGVTMFALRRLQFSSLFVFAALLVAAPLAPAQSREGTRASLTFWLYAVGVYGPGNGKLIAIDPVTATHVLAPLQFPAGLAFSGLAYDRHGKRLWTIATSAQGQPVLTSLNHDG